VIIFLFICQLASIQIGNKNVVNNKKKKEMPSKPKKILVFQKLCKKISFITQNCNSKFKLLNDIKLYNETQKTNKEIHKAT
jgi:hypothetical protein